MAQVKRKKAKGKSESGRPVVCHKHPDRIAATVVNGDLMCWECHLGQEAFADRFGAEFYAEGGPGRI